MKRLILVSMLLVAASAPSTANADPAAMAPLPECANAIDDDVDGEIDNGTTDEFGIPQGDADEGCSDDTPDTEELTSTPPIGRSSARGYARAVARDVFGGAYTGRYGEYLKCYRQSEVSHGCVISWGYRSYYYGARIYVYHYIDTDKDETWWGYRLRGWKFTPKCAVRKNPTRCASKRYLVT